MLEEPFTTNPTGLPAVKPLFVVYWAVTEYDVVGRVLVVHIAVPFTIPDPVTNEISPEYFAPTLLPPSAVKATVPPGAMDPEAGLTVAVNVAFVPYTEVFVVAVKVVLAANCTRSWLVEVMLLELELDM